MLPKIIRKERENILLLTFYYLHPVYKEDTKNINYVTYRISLPLRVSVLLRTDSRKRV